MNGFYRVVFAFIVTAVLAVSATAQSDWLGSYEFTEDGGKNAGGTPIIVTHQIDFLQSDDGLVAILKSNGYQTAVDVLCKVKIIGNKAMLHLEGYGDDNMFENYRRGELLLTLEKKTEKGKTDIITHWGSFKPAVPKNEKSGKVYFVKLAPNKP